MKVKDLILHLQAEDPEAEVVLWDKSSGWHTFDRPPQRGQLISGGGYSNNDFHFEGCPPDSHVRRSYQRGQTPQPGVVLSQRDWIEATLAYVQYETERAEKERLEQERRAAMPERVTIPVRFKDTSFSLDDPEELPPPGDFSLEG